MQAQLDVGRLGDARRRVRDLVLWALVLERELASRLVGEPPVLAKLFLKTLALLLHECPCACAVSRVSYRLGSMGLPAALFFNFRSVAGPMLARWSELGLVMIWSQMTAWLVALLVLSPAAAAAGHSAVT